MWGGNHWNTIGYYLQDFWRKLSGWSCNENVSHTLNKNTTQTKGSKVDKAKLFFGNLKVFDIWFLGKPKTLNFGQKGSQLFIPWPCGYGLPPGLPFSWLRTNEGPIRNFFSHLLVVMVHKTIGGWQRIIMLRFWEKSIFRTWFLTRLVNPSTSLPKAQ